MNVYYPIKDKVEDEKEEYFVHLEKIFMEILRYDVKLIVNNSNA